VIKVIKISVAFIILLSLSSCGNKHDLKIDARGDIQIPNKSSDVTVSPEIVFSDVVAEIFENDCKSCHAGYTKYSKVKVDIDRILREVLSNSMPQFGPPLSDEKKALLQDWVSLGAPEN
jgi:hypothetical protein